MNPMTSRIPFLLLCASMLAPVQALAKPAILPDGCGDDAIKFDAKLEKDNPGLPAIAEGKALIVFVETLPDARLYAGTTTRFGLDGAWVGATKSDAYFTIEVTPGEHNLCASMQSAPSGMKSNFTKTATFTAEAGKVYYFESVVNEIGGPNGGIAAFDFAQLSEKDGKYRVKAWKFATSKPKK
jgi:hypothetical protein